MKVAEWGSETVRTLSPQQVSAISKESALNIVPVGIDQWKISAKQFVGTVQLPDLTITIVPKVPIYRLMELLCESIDILEWSKTFADYDITDDLLSIIADSWCLAAESVLAQGLLQGYRSVDDVVFGIRGRVRMADQISHRVGLAIPVEVTYDDYTKNVLENQLLKGACTLLLRLPVRKLARRRLLQINNAIADVAPILAQPNPPEPVWTRLNERYRGAVFLSQLVLRACNLDMADRIRTQGSSFLVDMNRVFENVAGNAIKQYIEQHYGGKAYLQYSDRLDTGGVFSVRPDFVWKVDGKVRAVADFKYKLPTQKDVAISDVYQALTYCTKFRLEAVHLIYAEDPEKPLICVEGKSVAFDFVDIGADRKARQASIQRIAANIVACHAVVS